MKTMIQHLFTNTVLKAGDEVVVDIPMIGSLAENKVRLVEHELKGEIMFSFARMYTRGRPCKPDFERVWGGCSTPFIG